MEPPVNDLAAEFLTTRDLALLLHLKERKVYELAASGEVPCSRATGKLLFPRRGIEAWICRHGTGMAPGQLGPGRPAVMLGSHEPLLEWALRASDCGLAALLDGSLDGLARFARGEGVAAGLHLYSAAQDDWNLAPVATRFAHAPVVLVELAWRVRGLVVLPGREAELGEVARLRGRTLAPRQEAAGSQVLLLHLLDAAGLAPADVTFADTARSEMEAALSVLEGKADAALGLASVASQLRLGFVPLMRERFDLLVDRRAWFEPPMQRLLGFLGSEALRDKARALGGYDLGGFGRVHFNGA
jgi:molybdate-binding protein